MILRFFVRRKNLLRKGSFLLTLFLFQTFSGHFFPDGEKGGGGGLWGIA